jgi:hypothetical protein
LGDWLVPKKATHETQAEQSARFKRDAQKLIDAGELSPTEAAAALENLIRQEAGKRAGKLRGKTDQPI